MTDIVGLIDVKVSIVHFREHSFVARKKPVVDKRARASASSTTSLEVGWHALGWGAEPAPA